MRPVRLELLSDVLGHVMPCKDADELVRVYRPVLAFSPEESRCLVHRFSQMRAQLLRSADPDRRAPPGGGEHQDCAAGARSSYLGDVGKRDIQLAQLHFQLIGGHLPEFGTSVT